MFCWTVLDCKFGWCLLVPRVAIKWCSPRGFVGVSAVFFCLHALVRVFVFDCLTATWPSTAKLRCMQSFPLSTTFPFTRLASCCLEKKTRKIKMLLVPHERDVFLTFFLVAGGVPFFFNYNIGMLSGQSSKWRYRY
jgi:hypothetical protein